jgi:hypothetical protein
MSFPLGEICIGSLGPTHMLVCVFAVGRRNIAVPVDFAIVGKFAQTVLQAVCDCHSKPKSSNACTEVGHR